MGLILRATSLTLQAGITDARRAGSAAPMIAWWRYPVADNRSYIAHRGRRVLLKLFALFVLVPLTELFLLFKLAEFTSPEAALGLVILTGFLGSILARSQGFRTYMRIREELAAGRMPTDSLVDAVMIFIAGALLLTPGMLTDLFGFSLLIPFCRRFYRQRAQKWFRNHFKVTAFRSGPESPAQGSSQVIDSYVVNSSDDEP